MTADDVVTQVTSAPTDAAARTILKGIRNDDGLLAATADLLHIDPAGHELPWVRAAILAEARA